MKLYGVKDPNGMLIDIQPQRQPVDAYYHAAKLELAGKSGEQLRSGSSLGARCFRANADECSFPPCLAGEIAPLMGYQTVEVKVTEDS